MAAILKNGIFSKFCRSIFLIFDFLYSVDLPEDIHTKISRVQFCLIHQPFGATVPHDYVPDCDDICDLILQKDAY